MSFRSRILLLVLGVAVVPLGLIGFWLTGAALRSGEELLRSRLDESLRDDARTVAERWVPYRSALLDVADHPAARELLAGEGGFGRDLEAGLSAVVDALPPEVVAVALEDSLGRTVWSRQRVPAASPSTFGRPFQTRIDVRERFSGELRGVLRASLPLQALLRESAGDAPGFVVTALDLPEGVVLTPTTFDPALLDRDRFRWRDDEWITRSVGVREPRLRLVAAAPVSPFVAPFEATARRGGLVLLATALLGMALATVLTGRMTRSLESLARAAESVGQGELDPDLVAPGDDEIGRVARAFQQMTRSLRETLARLADREALAAVGEFAATLAHEVRNPLTAIQLDLQQVEERLPEGSRERALQGKALAQVRRLNRTVTGALETARSGRGDGGTVDVREPLARAIEAARPTFDEAGASLRGPASSTPVRVAGDPEGLESAFLNVLLNAGQAVGTGGSARVRVEAGTAEITVEIEDDGPGIPDEIRARVFEPLVSLRAGGTGLGLPVTRRIVEAHGGRVALDTREGQGTTVRIVLPVHGGGDVGDTKRDSEGGKTGTIRSGEPPGREVPESEKRPAAEG